MSTRSASSFYRGMFSGVLARKAEASAIETASAQPARRVDLFGMAAAVTLGRAAGPDPNEAKLRRVLLVEDSATLSMLYQQYLTNAGFEVTTVSN